MGDIYIYIGIIGYMIADEDFNCFAITWVWVEGLAYVLKTALYVSI